MSRHVLKEAILANVALCLLFVYFNFYLMGTLNIVKGDIAITDWTPLWITITSQLHHVIGGGPPGTYGGILNGVPNLLLILFLISTGVNLYFIVRLQRSKETKPTT